ncbi:TnsD family Tn7-like transposition protein [Paraburkholderia sp.]|uniref:TnsD family Tn7-like transposition protein n=1 Tax=Paraburkholderia sp. TaxID=1926495 RepID=UPI003C7198C1
MNEHGFTTSSGRFRWNEFLDAHCALHSEPFADARLTAVCLDKELIRSALVGWLSGRRSLHPVIYCLATWSLSQVSWTSPNHVKSKVQSRNRLESSAVVSAITRSPTLTSAAALLGVTATTLATRAGELGLPVARRPSVLKVECKEAIEKAFDSNLSPLAIASRLGVSVSTVYRVVRVSGQFDRRRTLIARARAKNNLDEWASLVSENTRASIQELRRQKPALFARLYRQSRGFTKCMATFSKPRPNNCRRSRVCQREFDRAIKNAQMMNGFSRSPRLSARRITQLAGISAYSLRTCSGSSRSIVTAVVEREREFVERRICEACVEMRVANLPCKRWAALRHSGMRLFRHRLLN